MSLTVQDEINAIVADAKGYRWGAELYTRVQQILPYANIFNMLRRELLPVEYDKFDLEYCEYIRPGQRDFITWLMKEQKRGELLKCKKMQREILASQIKSLQNSARKIRD